MVSVLLQIIQTVSSCLLYLCVTSCAFLMVALVFALHHDLLSVSRYTAVVSPANFIMLLLGCDKVQSCL